MVDRQFDYDIAFSLLSQDERLAQEIADLLSARYRIFLYSSRQKEIAGTDGEITFKKVFSEKARMVVVLYREGWGATPWTRMEEEAIRGRAYDEGYDFVKFIPLDSDPAVPKYLPKTQLWINALRFGAKGAAAAIEARLEELGATSRPESPVERAARLDRDLIFKRNHEEYARSDKAVRDSNESLKDVERYVRERVEKISALGVQFGLEVKVSRGMIVVVGPKAGLRIFWQYHYANSLDGSHLDIEVWSHHPPMPGVHFWEDPKKRASQRFHFELLRSGEGGWTKDDEAYNAEALADFALTYYMDHFG
jgi:hypothetical protein